MRTATHDLTTLLSDWVAVKSLPQIAVSGLQLDSRQVQTGDVFFAFPGTAQDSRQYLQQACERGAAAVVIEAQGASEFSSEALTCPVIAVTDLRAKVSAIASRFYRHPSKGLPVVGVTGTNGKTSCCHFIAQLLSFSDQRSAIMGTMGHGALEQLTAANNTTADPVTVQKQLAELRDADFAAVAMEVSSHALDQGRVQAVQFDTVVFTNLTRDHLDYHQTMQAYGAAKARLFAYPGIQRAIINADDPFGRQLLETCLGRFDLYAYTCDANRVRDLPGVQWVVATDIEYGHRGIQCQVQTPWGAGECRTQLLGDVNVYNALVALIVACTQGARLTDVLSHMAQLTPVKGRLELIAQANLPKFVIDYAHSPDALAHALQALREHLTGRLLCVVGCGGDRDVGKRAQMARIAEQYAHKVILTNDNPRTESPQAIIEDMLSGLAHPESVAVILDRAQAIAAAAEEADAEDVILVAGKGHEDYQIMGYDKIPFSDHAVVQQWCSAHRN